MFGTRQHSVTRLDLLDRDEAFVCMHQRARREAGVECRLLFGVQAAFAQHKPLRQRRNGQRHAVGFQAACKLVRQKFRPARHGFHVKAVLLQKARHRFAPPRAFRAQQDFAAEGSLKARQSRQRLV